MVQILKTLFIFTIFCNNCKDITSFDLILGLQNGGLIKTNLYQPDETTLIDQFSNGITSLIKFKNYLFISTGSTDTQIESNNVYRCSFDWKKLKFVKTNCDTQFDEVKAPNEYILRMVKAKTQIFLGRSDGVLWRCFAELSDKCELFYKASGKITGLDYDYYHNTIYASLWEGYLLRCPVSLPGEVVSCKVLHEMKDDKLTAVHVAYDVVWLGTGKGHLFACSSENIEKEIVLDDDFHWIYDDEEFSCFPFDKSAEPTSIVNIASRRKYLYISLANNNVLQCDFKGITSCEIVFKTQNGTESFITVNLK